MVRARCIRRETRDGPSAERRQHPRVTIIHVLIMQRSDDAESNREIAFCRRRSEVYFAFELDYLNWDRRSSDAATTFNEVVAFCAALPDDPHHRLVYQLWSRPRDRFQPQDSLDVALIGASPNTASARTFVACLSDLLASLDHRVAFRAVRCVDQLRALLAPLTPLHMAEIRQRRLWVSGVDIGAQATDGTDGAYHILRFAPAVDDVRRLSEQLLRQRPGVCIRCIVRPTALSATETDAVLAPLRTNESSELARLIRRLEGGQARLQALAGLQPTVEFQVLVASPESLTPTLLTSLAATLSPAGNGGVCDPQDLYGPGEVIHFDKAHDQARVAFKQLRILDARSDFAPPGLERLHRLGGPRHLACVLRLPIATQPHYPGIDVRATSNVEVAERALPRSGILIGDARARGSWADVRLADLDRDRGVYIAGKTGTGKSSLIEEMALADSDAGNGFCLIDPHGDLAERVLARLPRHRREDVILFDPIDARCRFALEFLDAGSTAEREFLVQDLSEMFYALYDPGHTGIVGPRFESWLRMAALTLMGSAPAAGPARFIDIPRCFTDDEFLKARFAHLRDDHVADFWTKEMARTSEYHRSEMLGWFNSKFNQFTGSPIVHEIFSRGYNDLNLATVMDERQILIMNLSKGIIGAVNARLLGYVITARLWVAALMRSARPAAERVPFTIYIDEFQNFSTASIDLMLSEGRKFGLRMVLANQFFGQLTHRMKAAVDGNIGTKICFRLGPTDAIELAPHFAPQFDSQSLQHLPNYRACCSLLVDGAPIPPFTLNTRFPGAEPDASASEAIRDLMSQRPF
jgi:hypothetical protein